MVSISRLKVVAFYLPLLIIVFIYPYVCTDPYVMWMTMMICIIGTLAVGLNVLTGFTGLISLGHAGFFCIGAYCGALLGIRLGISFFPALLISVVFSGVVGVILAYTTLRVSGVYFAMVTIAFGLVVENIVNEWQSMTKGPTGLDGLPPVQIWEFKFKEQYYFYLIAITFIVVILLGKNLMQSKYGRGLRAVSMNVEGAEVSGINSLRFRMLATIFSAVCAGMAGCYFAYLNLFLSPRFFNFDLSILFLVIVIFGGLGTILGPIVGTIILLVLPEIIQKMAEYRLIVYGCVLLLVLIFMPAGVVGSVRELIEKIAPLLFRKKHEITDGKIEGKLSIHLLSRARLVLQENSQNTKDETLLEIRNITKRFGGLEALHNLQMAIKPNTIHSLIGPNGAGKTTLVNLISGIYQPTSGEVYFEGKRVDGLPNWTIGKMGIGRTFQRTKLFSDLSVCENVVMGFSGQIEYGLIRSFLHTKSMRREERLLRDKAIELLNFVGYMGDVDNVAKHLPFGHQRLVEIARALAVNPLLLLLDEPAAGLISNEIEGINKLVKKLREYGVTILLVEHHVEFVMAVSDVVTVLNYGEKLAEGRPEEVRKDPAVIDAYLGSTKH